MESMHNTMQKDGYGRFFALAGVSVVTANISCLVKQTYRLIAWFSPLGLITISAIVAAHVIRLWRGILIHVCYRLASRQ